MSDRSSSFQRAIATVMIVVMGGLLSVLLAFNAWQNETNLHNYNVQSDTAIVATRIEAELSERQTYGTVLSKLFRGSSFPSADDFRDLHAKLTMPEGVLSIAYSRGENVNYLIKIGKTDMRVGHAISEIQDLDADFETALTTGMPVLHSSARTLTVEDNVSLLVPVVTSAAGSEELRVNGILMLELSLDPVLKAAMGEDPAASEMLIVAEDRSSSLVNLVTYGSASVHTLAIGSSIWSVERGSFAVEEFFDSMVGISTLGLGLATTLTLLIVYRLTTRSARVPGSREVAVRDEASKHAADDIWLRFSDFSSVAEEWFWETDDKYFIQSLAGNYRLVPKLFSGDFLNIHSETTIDLANSKFVGTGSLSDALIARKAFKDIAFKVPSDSGEPIIIRLSGKPYYGEKGKFLGFRGAGQNITEQVSTSGKVQKELALQSVFAEVLIAVNMAKSAMALLTSSRNILAEHLKYDIGRVLINIPSDGSFAAIGETYRSDHFQRHYADRPSIGTFNPNQAYGLSELAIKNKKLECLPDITAESVYCPFSKMEGEEHLCGIAVPVMMNRNPVVVFEFYAMESRKQDNEVIDMLTKLAIQIAYALDRYEDQLESITRDSQFISG